MQAQEASQRLIVPIVDTFDGFHFQYLFTQYRCPHCAFSTNVNTAMIPHYRMAHPDLGNAIVAQHVHYYLVTRTVLPNNGHEGDGVEAEATTGNTGRSTVHPVEDFRVQ